MRTTRMRRWLPVSLALLLWPLAAAAADLWSISPDDAVLRRISAADGSTRDASLVLTLSGSTVTGGNGLARHPQTGVLYALLKLQGQAGRQLVTLDETTGAATSIGNTGDRFAGIAFASDGRLFAVTGDGASTPETLYTLSLANGSPTFAAALGHGDDGEAIAFDPVGARLYHASGFGPPNDPNFGEVLETVDPNTFAVTPVTLSGFDHREVTALIWGGQNLFGVDLDPLSLDPNDVGAYLRITPSGVVTELGQVDHRVKGLAFAPFAAPLWPYATAR